jgi:hypothetical protein
MANESLTNPFGLIDERVVRAIRKNQEIADARIRANQTQGVNFASRELGNFVGKALGLGLRKAGVLKDPEMERAQEISSAQRRAQVAIDGTPDEIKPTDPYESSIFEREQLAKELRAAGLTQEASIVNQQVLQLREQNLKMQKLQGEVTSQKQEIEFHELTKDDEATTIRTTALQNTLQYGFDLSTNNTRVLKTELELEQLADTMGHQKQIRPHLRAKAASDAQVAAAEAKLGGPAPTLLRLQARRDAILNHIAMQPDDKWAQQNLEEINKKIATEAMGITRNIDSQVEGIIDKLESTTDEPFGKVADTRAAIASGINTVLPLVGLPPSLTSSMAEFIISDDEVDIRSESRQLRADLIDWISGNSRSTSVDVDVAEDLTQSMLDATDRRTVTVALTNLSSWMMKKQLLLDSTLLQGLEVVSPSQQGEDEDGSQAAAGNLFDNLNQSFGGQPQ